MPEKIGRCQVPPSKCTCDRADGALGRLAAFDVAPWGKPVPLSMRTAGAPKLGGIGSAGGEPSAAFERQPHRRSDRVRTLRIDAPGSRHAEAYPAPTSQPRLRRCRSSRAQVLDGLRSGPTQQARPRVGLLDGSKPPDLSPIPSPVVTIALPAPITRRASGRRSQRAAISANTRRAYESAMRQLDAWLAGRELDDAALAGISSRGRANRISKPAKLVHVPHFGASQ